MEVGARRLWISLLTVLLVLCFTSSAFAQSIIKYLPRNEDMDSRFKVYDPPLEKGEVLNRLCSQSSIFRRAAECYRCIQELLPNCHNCCIDTVSGKRFVKCTTTDCGFALFSNAACGCDSLTAGPDGACEKKGNAWYCKEDNLEAKLSCLNQMDEKIKKDIGCDLDTDEFFKASVKMDDPVPANQSPECPAQIGSPCYKYTPSNEFLKCTGKCGDYVKDYDKCQGGIEQCKNGACRGTDCFRASQSPCGRLLYDQICGRQECKDIADSPTCNWNVNSQECADLSNQAVDCLTTLDPSSDCARCFQEIDPSFSYKFIAKSRESITLIWEMGSKPSWVDTQITQTQEEQLAPAYYLYTRVKVFDADEPNRPIYMSPVHQKYLGAAFSVFCAGHIDAEKLKQGHRYFVRVYYYLTDTSHETKYNLKVQINNLRITVVRIRE